MEVLALLVCGGMFVLLALGMNIGLAMILAGFVGMANILWMDSALHLLGQTVLETALNAELSVLPLFVLMGYFASASGMSSDLYSAFHTWLGHRRGGLAMATVGACGAFGAISGSSVATAATMSQIALPEMRRFGYSDSLATGVIAAGGTLGILIPPSVIMVIYGIMTETDIGSLFIAGIVPGLLLVGLFMVTVRLMAYKLASDGGTDARASRAEYLAAIRNVGGTLALFALVLGGIYLSVFSASEAAGIGAIGALALGVVSGKMSWTGFFAALTNAVRTTVMIFTILIGAIVFKNFMALAQVPTMIETWMIGLSLGPLGTLLVIVAVYIVLGALLDTLAMILLTIPVFFPLVISLGYDPVWFGILIVVVVEMALISPPMGINVFVMKGMAKDVPLITIYQGVLPFVGALAVLLAALILVPQIATWLPGR